MNMEYTEFEQVVFEYIDRIKELLSPKMWQNVLLDCSKNELFILWLLYRNHEVNMSQIAEYIHVPLNTATGIIARMEKKTLVIRERSPEDKRIVTIRMGEAGEQQIHAILQELMYYGKKIIEAFSEEEMNVVITAMNKLTDIMKEERSKDTKKPRIKKITIE